MGTDETWIGPMDPDLGLGLKHGSRQIGGSDVIRHIRHDPIMVMGKYKYKSRDNGRKWEKSFKEC
uniref:Uncharacterized protein n=1 Tax=Romanomermis culicivorax TaxID=13658 RepID=A0A915HMK1_ROMCU